MDECGSLEPLATESEAKTEREAKVKIGDAEFSIFSDDNYLVHLGSEFEPHTTAVIKSLVRPTDHVLDIGANIGATSLLLGQIAKSVVSFEAAPSTFRFLEQNVKASNLANVTLVNVGLGSKRQVMQITIAPSNRSGAYISNKTEASAGHIQENVQIETLDGFLEAGAHVDFIKLDVEGFELEVLKGANEVLRSSRPTVMLEMNHWCLNAFQRISLPEFIEFLTDLFPIVVAVEGDTYLDLRDPGQRYIVMYKHIVEGFKYIDVVCSFEESRIAAFRQAFSHAS